tara:strand:- start:2933 stop:3952 length:1020 start_codon:yes stop_codon:yes gene_type:complete
MRKILLLFVLTPCLGLSQTELVTNGTFDTDLSSWTTSGSVIYKYFFSNGCTSFSGGNSPVTGIISQNISVTSGATLTVTLNYVRRGSGGIVTGLFEIIDNNTTAVISNTTLTGLIHGVFHTTSFTFVAPHNSLLIRFTDQTSITNARDFYFNTISITQPIPLPIELIDFTANLTNNGHVKLDWQTASEVNNDYFTIERSINGQEWQEINKIDGAGNSSSLLSYSEVDYNPFYGVSYYRLKQTDFDGLFEYSQIRSVNIQRLPNSQIGIYPNPSTNQIIITGSSNELEEIVLYNTLGQNVTSLTNQVILNETQLVIDISKLNRGVYYVKTKTTANKVYKQ